MEEPEYKTVIRRYLLGDLSETEQRPIEESFLLNLDYRENLLIAEHELIEDYLDGALSEQERNRFESYFLATPQQRQKLRIARSLKGYAVGKPTVPAFPAKADLRSENRPARTGRWLKLRRPLILVPMAAVLLIAITIGALKLIELRRSRAREAQEQSRRIIIEQELARINSLDGRRASQGLTVILPPVSLRGAGRSRKFSPPADKIPVEFQLVIDGEQYPAYRALLQKMEASQSFAIPNLRAASTPAGKAVPLRIPTHLLTRGRYRLQLFGVTATGENEFVGDYDFEVTDND